MDEWWGHQVNIDGYFFDPQMIKKTAQLSGFSILEVIEREPYAEDIEYQSRRAYILLKSPHV